MRESALLGSAPKVLIYLMTNRIAFTFVGAFVLFICCVCAFRLRNVGAGTEEGRAKIKDIITISIFTPLMVAVYIVFAYTYLP